MAKNPFGPLLLTAEAGQPAAGHVVLTVVGARSGEVPAMLADGRLGFEIGPQFKTLWYEIAAE